MLPFRLISKDILSLPAEHRDSVTAAFDALDKMLSDILSPPEPVQLCEVVVHSPPPLKTKQIGYLQTPDGKKLGGMIPLPHGGKICRADIKLDVSNACWEILQVDQIDGMPVVEIRNCTKIDNKDFYIDRYHQGKNGETRVYAYHKLNNRELNPAQRWFKHERTDGFYLSSTSKGCSNQFLKFDQQGNLCCGKENEAGLLLKFVPAN